MIRIPTHTVPTHPGEMLLEEFLVPMRLRASAKNNSTSCLPVVPSPAFHPPAHIPICIGGCALATNPHSAPYCGIIYFHDPKTLDFR
jgi:hypothetical protein